MTEKTSWRQEGWAWFLCSDADCFRKGHRALIQNRCRKVVNRGALRLRGGP